MMLDVNITFLDISPEVEFDNRRGHLIRYAYRPVVDDEFFDSEINRTFNFIEDVRFRLEWRRYSGSNFALLKSREQQGYPTEHIRIEKDLVRSGKAFLDRDFLTYQNGFVEAPELFCRISLIPVLATQRESIGYVRQGAFYKLVPASRGSETEFDSGMPGYEY